MGATTKALDAEWARISAGDEGRRALRRWQAVHPELVDLKDLDALLQRRLDPAAAPRVLTVLARLAPTDPVAARTLLQALMPGLMRLATTAGYDDPSALEELVSLAWERIRTYPTTRCGSVAANVLWDVRKRYRQHRHIEAPRTTSSGDKAQSEHEPSAEEVVLGRLVLDDLAAAQRNGVISARSLRLIIRTRLDGDSLDEVARDEQTNVHAITQRRWRAERRLRALPDAG